MKTARFSIFSFNSDGSNLNPEIKNSSLIRGMLACLVLFLAFWLIPRFIPFDSLCKRGLECALLYPEKDAPFRADVSIERGRVCGDLVALYGNDAFCEARKENFLTDHFGFRNAPNTPIESAQIILLGDSFAFGQGLDQDLIPSRQIESTLQVPVYSGAGKLDPRSIMELSRRAGPGKIFLYLDLDRSRRTPNDLDSKNGSELYERWKSFRETFKNYNPLKIILTRIDHAITSHIFPPKASQSVSSIAVHGDRPFLFMNSSLNRGSIPRDWMNDRITYFTKLRDTLQTHKQKLFVVLVPEKSTVYITDEKTRGEDLDRLSLELNRAGIPSLSIATRFQKEALQTRDHERPLYYSDDTHWAPEGVKLMAEMIGNDPQLLSWMRSGK